MPSVEQQLQKINNQMNKINQQLIEHFNSYPHTGNNEFYKFQKNTH